MKFLLTLVTLLVLAACGVRGDPQPPLTGAEIGHGQPSFKRAGSESDFASVPAAGSSSGETTPTPTPAE